MNDLPKSVSLQSKRNPPAIITAWRLQRSPQKFSVESPPNPPTHPQNFLLSPSKKSSLLPCPLAAIKYRSFRGALQRRLHRPINKGHAITRRPRSPSKLQLSGLSSMRTATATPRDREKPLFTGRGSHSRRGRERETSSSGPSLAPIGDLGVGEIVYLAAIYLESRAASPSMLLLRGGAASRTRPRRRGFFDSFPRAFS